VVQSPDPDRDTFLPVWPASNPPSSDSPWANLAPEPVAATTSAPPSHWLPADDAAPVTAPPGDASSSVSAPPVYFPDPIDRGPSRRNVKVALVAAGIVVVAVIGAVLAYGALKPAPIGLAGLPDPVSPERPAASAPTIAGSPSTSAVPPSAAAGASAGTTPHPSGSTGGTQPAGGAKAVQTGTVKLKLANTGMCVGEGPELFKNTGRTVLGQHTCSKASPAIGIEKVSGTVYRITVGGACAAVDYDGVDEGLLLAGRDCSSANNQRFMFEPVSSPANGFRLHSVSGQKWCIGPLQESLKGEGTQIMQQSCDGGADQIFVF
jgi:hypothetical protein